MTTLHSRTINRWANIVKSTWVIPAAQPEKLRTIIRQPMRRRIG